ncbi:MAG: hypothetical protein U1F00_19055 [Rhodoferax sp.]
MLSSLAWVSIDLWRSHRLLGFSEAADGALAARSGLRASGRLAQRIERSFRQRTMAAAGHEHAVQEFLAAIQARRTASCC